MSNPETLFSERCKSNLRHLNTDEEWTRRIEALLRLEGLVRGGAPSVPGFPELLKTLQDPIVAQLLDRCAHLTAHAWHKTKTYDTKILAEWMACGDENSLKNTMTFAPRSQSCMPGGKSLNCEIAN